MANIQQKIETFANNFAPQQYAARQIIVEAEEEPGGIYWLESGQVRQYIISDEGEELTVHLFEPGSFFPLMWAMNRLPNRHTYEAVTATRLRIIPADKFIAFIEDQPDILFSLAQRLLYGLNGLLLRVESLSLQSAYKRVISILIYLARHFGTTDKEGIAIKIRLTHKDIATYAGLARETTSVEMSKLEKQHIIGYRGTTLIIYNLSTLESLLQ